MLCEIPKHKLDKSQAAGIEMKRASRGSIMPSPPWHCNPFFEQCCDGSTKSFYFIDYADEENEAQRSCDLPKFMWLINTIAKTWKS